MAPHHKHLCGGASGGHSGLGSSLTEDYNPDSAADPKGGEPEHQNKSPQGQVSLGHGLVGEGALALSGAGTEVVFGLYHFAEGGVNCSWN